MCPSFTSVVLEDNRELGVVNNSTEVAVRHQEVVRSLAWRPLGNAEGHVGSTGSSFSHTSVSICKMG